VSPEYNYMEPNNAFPDEEIAEYYGIPVPEIEKIKAKPTILHITNKVKPWNAENAPCKELWFSYLLQGDREQILSNICKCEAKRVSDLLQSKSVVSTVSREMKCFKEQYLSDYEYRKNQNAFCLDESKAGEYAKLLLMNRHMIKSYLEKKNKVPIIIYGAGKVGMALFQCLWDVGMSESVLGFAVTDLEWNVRELYGKRVDTIEAFSQKDALVVVAFKSKKADNSDIKSVIQMLNVKGYANCVDINAMVAEEV